MKEEKEVRGEPENGQSEISGNKFHSLYSRDLAVALEATFFGETEIVVSGEMNFPKLISPAPEIHCALGQPRRVYFPAVTGADMAVKTAGEIKFIPWVDETEVQYHRLVFRLRPMDRERTKNFRWVRFARFGEERAFGFKILTGDPYINLDFMSKRKREFVPLYAKIQGGTDDYIYFELTAKAGEEAITLKVRRVNEAEAPPHLAQAKP